MQNVYIQNSGNLAFTGINSKRVIKSTKRAVEAVVCDGVKFGVGAVPAYVDAKSKGHGEIVSGLIGIVAGFITKLSFDSMEGMQLTKKVFNSVYSRHKINYEKRCSDAIKARVSPLSFLRLTLDTKKKAK